MPTKRTIQLTLLTAVMMSLLATGCYKKPEFAFQPALIYKSITIENTFFDNGGSPAPIDSIIILLDFQDGDGDIGLTSSEEPDSLNLTTLVEKRVAPGKYEIALDTAGLPGNLGGNVRIPPVLDEGKRGPVEGTISIRVGIIPGFNIFGDEPLEYIRFQIKLKDRAGNESNVVVTDSVKLSEF